MFAILVILSLSISGYSPAFADPSGPLVHHIVIHKLNALIQLFLQLNFLGVELLATL